MPRQSGITVDNNFVRGLVTEATGLSFPENACTETFDCVFKKTGEVCRRKGLDYEASYNLFTLTAARSLSAVSSFLWTGAGGDGNSNFVVVQVGRYIYFYEVGESLSTGKHGTSVDLSSFVVSSAVLPYSKECRFTQGDGKLFVVSPSIEPFYVTYTPSTDIISSGTQITIEVRDIDGDTADPYAVDERPTATVDSVDIHHLYNLWNQGWANDVRENGGTLVNPVSDWDAGETTIPSNADRWWTFKDSSDELDTANVEKVTRDKAPAPKGHFIFNAFNIDRNTATNSAGVSMDTEYSLTGETQAGGDLTVDSTDARPSSVSFFSNRVFYAGVDGDGYNSNIYFSQVLTDISRAGRCYQEFDPTSETLSDLVPTDGGVIHIPEIANIVHMEQTRSSLVVFATNGIWQISGSEGIGFSATDFAVTKISTLRNSRNSSFVNLNGVPAWINSEGVWLFQEDQSLGSTSVTSLSKDSIQTWFEEEIPAESIRYIKGAYNQSERRVYWLFKSTFPGNLDGSYQYDRCLIFNTETGAFYPWKLNTTTDVKILDVKSVAGSSTSTEESTVVDSSIDTVIDSSLDTVIANSTVDVAIAGSTKFLTENNSSQITWSDAADTNYLDWTTPLGSGINYESYFITGYKIRGEGLRTQQSNYIRVHSRVESNSSLKVRGVWDYYTSSGARWSTEQQAYKTGTNTDYTERRLKIRGNGLALQLRFGSEQGKPFNLIGWSSWDTVSNVA